MLKIVHKKLTKTPIDIKKIKVNQKLYFNILITDKVHKNFEKFSGDDSPVHTKINFCKNNGYSKKVGYGFLLNWILSQIYGKYFPGGNELCLSQTGIFKSPFFVGDQLKIVLIVTHKNTENQIINLSTSFFRKKNIKVFEGNAVLKLSLI